MMLANVPVAYAGKWLMHKIPLNLARWSACGLFVGLGVLSIIAI
jgi:putative Ca2+/H+ antiporter (TMEM165/GDT1 family)